MHASAGLVLGSSAVQACVRAKAVFVGACTPSKAFCLPKLTEHLRVQDVNVLVLSPDGAGFVDTSCEPHTWHNVPPGTPASLCARAASASSPQLHRHTAECPLYCRDVDGTVRPGDELLLVPITLEGSEGESTGEDAASVGRNTAGAASEDAPERLQASAPAEDTSTERRTLAVIQVLSDILQCMF